MRKTTLTSSMYNFYITTKKRLQAIPQILTITVAALLHNTATCIVSKRVNTKISEGFFDEKSSGVICYAKI